MSVQTKSMTSPRKSWLRSNWATLLISVFGLLAGYFLLNLIIGGKCDENCVVSTIAQTLRTATPLVFAAFCGLICERAGVTDIGIEGKMLMAAMAGYAVNLFAYQGLLNVMPVDTAATVSRLLGLLAAVLSAVPLSALHAFLCINIKADQIISGTVINILAIGITGYFYRQFLAQNVPPGPGTFPLVNIPLLDKIPWLGPIFFQQKPLTYVMIIGVFLIQYVLFFTPWGLRTRAVGEHPRAADTLGVNVYRMRWINVLVGGVLAGLGGAWFTLEAVDVFTPLMTNGAGFIGLAAMIFGKWNPFGALIGALIFGLGSSVTSTIGIFRPDIPSQIPDMLPYILTIIVLTGVVGRAIAPAADGTPYEK
jgi:general nucleoside transport system permease protein